MEIFGVAIFASVVLYLTVTHKGFRKVVIWVGAACLLCAIAGGFYLWHVHRAKLAAQVADDAIQNVRIARADAWDANNQAAWFDLSQGQLVPVKPPPGFVFHPPPPKHRVAKHWLDLSGPFGNARLVEPQTVFSCNAHRIGDDILAHVADGTRVKILRFGYEWGAYGNYGAKIQLANGLTGCILDGNTLKLDGE